MWAKAYLKINLTHPAKLLLQETFLKIKLRKFLQKCLIPEKIVNSTLVSQCFCLQNPWNGSLNVTSLIIKIRGTRKKTNYWSKLQHLNFKQKLELVISKGFSHKKNTANLYSVLDTNKILAYYAAEEVSLLHLYVFILWLNGAH